jgi:hypothetical protein
MGPERIGMAGLPKEGDRDTARDGDLSHKTKEDSDGLA